MITLPNQERSEQTTSEIPLSSEQQEILGLIDVETESIKQANGVIDLVGVIAGIKPVAFLDKDQVNADLIGAMGISCESIDDESYAISRDENLSLELKELFLSRQGESGAASDEWYRQFGTLLGYPDTAIDYYIKRMPTVFTDTPLPFVEPDSIEGTTTSYFNQLVLSPDNYEAELDEYVKPLEAAVKKLAPKTYEFIEQGLRDGSISQ